MPNRIKKWVFPLISVLVPFIVLLAAEGIARIALSDSAKPPLFKPLEQKPGYIAINPDYGSDFFQSFKPAVAFQPFHENKPDRTLRGFVLGGSSTAGFPYSAYYSFSSAIQQNLTKALPEQNVEIINLGMTAINSFTIRDMAPELIEQNPDFIVLYAGHNEYYGAYGVGSSQGVLGSYAVKRLSLLANHSVLVRFLRQLFSSPKQEVSETSRTMMESVINNAQITLDSKTYTDGIHQFERNIGHLISAFEGSGIPVFMGTLTSNLKDQSPFGESESSRKNFKDATDAFNRKEYKEAFQLFNEAKERDPVRFRAPDAINQTIRSFAYDNLILVDMDSLFRAFSFQGIPGDSLFDDHLHPNGMGHNLMGNLFSERIIAKLNHSYNPPFPRLHINRMEQLIAEGSIVALKSRPPYSTSGNKTQALTSFKEKLDQQGYSGQLAGLVLEQKIFYNKATRQALSLALAEKDTAQVLELYYASLHWNPFSNQLHSEVAAFCSGALLSHSSRTEQVLLKLVSLSDKPVYKEL
ncbi:MAG: hypothetical protein AAFW89_14400, partial [Bacteroidota bacterium]